MAIKCPGGKEILSSRETGTARGVFTESTMGRAKSAAATTVLNDLVRQIGEAKCEGGTRCMVREIDRTQMRWTRDVSKRLWWTLFIVVECKVTAEQRVTVECVTTSSATELGLPN
jgi:hypothetical protein